MAGGKTQALWGHACSDPCLILVQCRNGVRSAHLSKDFLILLWCTIISSVFLTDPERCWQCRGTRFPSMALILALWQSWILLCLASTQARQAKFVGTIIAPSLLQCTQLSFKMYPRVSRQETCSNAVPLIVLCTICVYMLVNMRSAGLVTQQLCGNPLWFSVGKRRPRFPAQL